MYWDLLLSTLLLKYQITSNSQQHLSSHSLLSKHDSKMNFILLSSVNIFYENLPYDDLNELMELSMTVISWYSHFQLIHLEVLQLFSINHWDITIPVYYCDMNLQRDIFYRWVRWERGHILGRSVVQHFLSTVTMFSIKYCINENYHKYLYY